MSPISQSILPALLLIPVAHLPLATASASPVPAAVNECENTPPPRATVVEEDQPARPPRATVVEEDNHNPPPRATVVEDTPAPAPPQPPRPQAPPSAATQNDPAAPLAAPGADDMLKVAHQLFNQASQPDIDPAQRSQLLGIAAQRYADFIRQFPQDPSAATALYQLGTIASDFNDKVRLQQYFERLIRDFPKNKLAASAAYRLGLLAMEREQWQEATVMFRKAAESSDKPAVRADAYYRLGLASYNLNQKQNALTALLAATREPRESTSPQLRAAAFSLAGQIQADFQQRQAAIASFEEAAKALPNSALAAQSFLRAGDLASALNQPDDAANFFRKAIEADPASSSTSSGLARLGLISQLFQKKKYDDILKIADKNLPPLADPAREAQLQMIIGQTLFIKNRFGDAAQRFAKAERAAPLGDVAFECSFRRLLCASELNSPDIIDRARAFLDVYAPKQPNHAYSQSALLIAAEAYLKLNRKQEAAKTYALINPALLDPNTRLDVLFKKGWIQADTGDRPGAIKAFSDFIALAPPGDSTRLPSAYVSRGELYMNQQDDIRAMDDFDKIAKTWPKSAAAAAALQRSAQILSRKSDLPGAIKRYEALIKNFPDIKPAAIADARYMCGRAYFDLKNYKEAIPHLEEAKTLLPEKFNEPAGLLLVLAYYQEQNFDKLKSSLDRLWKDVPATKTSIPEAIPTYIGQKCFAAKDYAGADHYLSSCTNPKDAARTKNLIWHHLAISRFQTKSFDRALTAINLFLDGEKQPYRKAEGLLDKTRILIQLNKLEDADKAVADALELNVEGPIKAAILIESGNIAFARKKFDDAARKFVQVAELFTDDKSLKPQAYYMAAQSLEKSGKPEEAQRYRLKLREEFPDWKPEN